jgi:hypothetical protein
MRLRVGIALWLLSWVPFAVLLGATGTARLLIWGVQIVVGIIGVALAGTAFAAAVKLAGWRHAPAVAWSSFAHGTDAGARPSS